MELIKIGDKNAQAYEKLDPFILLPRLSLHGYAGLGLEDSGKPAGLLILHKSRETVCIDWLYVAQDHRGKGLGEQLLDAAYRYAILRGSSTLTALFPGYQGRKITCPVEKGYLMDRYLEQTAAFAPEWRLSWQEIRRTGLAEEVCGGDAAEEFVFLHSMTHTETAEILTKLDGNEDMEMLYPLHTKPGSIDTDVSVLCRKNGVITGAAIFAAAEEELFLTGFLALKNSTARALFAGAVQAAKKKYHEDLRLNILLENEGYEDIFRELFGDGIARPVLIGDLRMYLADQAYEVEDFDFLEAMTAA